MYVDQSLSLKNVRKNLNNYIKKIEEISNNCENKQCPKTKIITYKREHYL